MKKPELYVEKRGTGENKVIFLHGFGASRKSFYDLAPFFDKTYELHLIDLIGFGNSKFIRGWEYTYHNQTKMVYEYLKSNNLKNVTVIGNSYGGGIALFLMLLANDLNNNDTISKSVLIGPACYRQKVPLFIRFPAHVFLYKLFMFFFPKKLLGMFMLLSLYYNKGNITREKINRYSGYLRKKGNLSAVSETSKHIVPDNTEFIEQGIKYIKTPVLIIYGAKDSIIPAVNINRLNRELLNSQLIKVPEAGHMIHEEMPEKTYKYIDKFIKNV